MQKMVHNGNDAWMVAYLLLSNDLIQRAFALGSCYPVRHGIHCTYVRTQIKVRSSESIVEESSDHT